MGVFSKLFGFNNLKIQKEGIFQEFKKEFSGNQEMINISKASWLSFRGTMFCKQQNYDYAINDLKEAIEIDPDCLTAYIPLAMSYRGKGMLDESIAILNELIQKKTSSEDKSTNLDFDLYCTLANIYFQKGDKSKTIECAKKAIEVENNPEMKKEIDEAIHFREISASEIDASQQIESLKKLIKTCENSQEKEII